MNVFIYVLAGISIILSIGGIAGWKATGSLPILASSMVSIIFSLAAIALPHWWPLIAGLAINWTIKITTQSH